MHLGHAVLRRQHKGLGQVVTGDHLALGLGVVQKIPGALGGGGRLSEKLGFAELTIDNGQLTIVVSLRDEFESPNDPI